MIAFIDDHRAVYGVEPICNVLPIAPSTYHDHVAKRADPSRLSDRAKRDLGLKTEIERVFAENFEVYGARKVWRQLNREGIAVARCTVERLMAGLGLQGVIRGKPIKTTIADRAAPCPLDHVNRQFHAPAPNMLWLSDFTYVSTWTGFVYVAFVIDAYARRIVGWRVSRMRVSCSTRLSRPCMNGGRRDAAVLSTIPTGVLNTSVSDTPSGLQRPVSSLLSAASGTATTMLSPKRSTASTRQRSFTAVDRGGASRPSSSRH